MAIAFFIPLLFLFLTFKKHLIISRPVKKEKLYFAVAPSEFFQRFLHKVFGGY